MKSKGKMASNKIFEPSFTIDYMKSEFTFLNKKLNRDVVKFEVVDKAERIIDFKKKYILKAIIFSFLIAGICGMIYYNLTYKTIDLNLTEMERVIERISGSYIKYTTFDTNKMIRLGLVTSVISASIAGFIASLINRTVPQYRIYLKNRNEIDVLIREFDYKTLVSIISPELEIIKDRKPNQIIEKISSNDFEISKRTSTKGLMNSNDKYELLIKLKNLFDQEIINQNEFDSEKKKILN